MTLPYLLDKYGLMLDKKALCELFHMKARTFDVAVARGTFPIPTFRLGLVRHAHAEDVANHINLLRQKAAL